MLKYVSEMVLTVWIPTAPLPHSLIVILSPAYSPFLCMKSLPIFSKCHIVEVFECSFCHCSCYPWPSCIALWDTLPSQVHIGHIWCTLDKIVSLGSYFWADWEMSILTSSILGELNVSHNEACTFTTVLPCVAVWLYSYTFAVSLDVQGSFQMYGSYSCPRHNRRK